MKIINTPPVKALEKARRKPTGGSASSVDFESYLDHLDETGDSQAAQETAGVNSFLFMQEVSDEQVARQKALLKGKQTIAILEQLHRDLLVGTVPEATLRKLQSVVEKQKNTFTDPKLEQMMKEIELRAAVELAKLEQAKPK